MRKYEIMFIVRPTLSEEEVKNVVAKFTNVLTTNGAKIVEEKNLGQRELAYEIKKFKTGFYYLITIEANDDVAIKEFDRQSKNTPDIIRNLITKIEK